MKYATRVLPALAATVALAGCGSSSGIKAATAGQVATTVTPAVTVTTPAPNPAPAKTVTVTAPTPAPKPAPVTPAAPSSNLTTSQQNAAQAARGYLSIGPFSKQGLINQLSSSAGDGYSVQDATVAVDGLNVDWTAEAVKAAKSYLQTSSFSCQGLTEQLSSSAGDGYTVAQAQAAATKVGLC